ncbi:MAG: LysM peptidoglycan-binding domain-containing protein [Bacteroidota bacterium]
MVQSKKLILVVAICVLLFLIPKKQNSTSVTANTVSTSKQQNSLFNLAYLSPISSRDSIMDSLLSVGKLFIGRPYRSRVYNSWPLDCSGFAAYLYSLFGYDLPRASPAQALLGQKVAMDSLKRGDLMFFKGRNSHSTGVGHTTIFYKAAHDTIYFLHSSSSGIKIDKLNGYAYYTSRYLFSKRMNLDQLKRVPVDKLAIARLDSALKKMQSNGGNRTTSVGHATTTQNTISPDGKYYIIKKGDSLYAISQKFGTTVDTLCSLNGIKKTSLLSIGQKIRIK